MDPEIGALEKRIRRSRKPRLVLAGVEVLQIAVCALVAAFYDPLYSRSPAGCAAIMSLLMCGMSQGLVQLLTDRIDFWRLVKFHVWGVINGLWTRFWTEQLTEKYDSTFAKIAWDQAFGNPFSVFMFTTLSAFWEGYNIDLYLQKNFKPAFRASLMIWPLASIIQFVLIPHKYIIVYNTVVNFLWNVVLGLVS